MQVHQMSVGYQPDQDRILTRVNTTAGEEIRLWLTRRMIIRLWPMLDKLHTERLFQREPASASPATADPGLQKMLTDFRKEELLQQADFNTPFKEADMLLPLGNTPLLVARVDAAPQEQGLLRLSFHEQATEGGQPPRTCDIDLTPQLVQGWLHLLSQSLQNSQWTEAFTPTNSAESALAGGTSAQPTYLN